MTLAEMTGADFLRPLLVMGWLLALSLLLLAAPASADLSDILEGNPSRLACVFVANQIDQLPRSASAPYMDSFDRNCLKRYGCQAAYEPMPKTFTVLMQQANKVCLTQAEKDEAIHMELQRRISNCPFFLNDKSKLADIQKMPFESQAMMLSIYCRK